jgi:tRNA(Ile2) C34 agmatinyltransferase TiaS
MNIIVKPRPRRPSLASALAQQPAYIEDLRIRNLALVHEIEKLRNLLAECRSHIDVSLINNSKRSTAKWEALIDKIETALKQVGAVHDERSAPLCGSCGCPASSEGNAATCMSPEFHASATP